jgi:hypothetical protein
MQTFPDDPVEFDRIAKVIFSGEVEPFGFLRPISCIVCRLRDVFILSRSAR